MPENMPTGTLKPSKGEKYELWFMMCTRAPAFTPNEKISGGWPTNSSSWKPFRLPPFVTFLTVTGKTNLVKA